MREIYDLAREHGLAVHLDGARIFNAAVAAGRPVTDFTRYADSVSVCLSKGLSAPVGSLLAGRPKSTAAPGAKLVGGGMRQAGVLAAAGIVALEKMVDRLAEDHVNASRLAEAGRHTGHCHRSPAGADEHRQLSTWPTRITDGEFLKRLRGRGVLAGSTGAGADQDGDQPHGGRRRH